ncbi:hypothetical protein [Nocardioides pelophilus]|uniref:hypothetical protein n=1 Tax=Nocardioides pelophilus TaxID=2172019 RepID=UPI001603918C|nr:hypothetical protein [Nocardioides pelophilus]
MIWLILGVLLLSAAFPVLHRALVDLESSLLAIDQALSDVVMECQRIVPVLDGIPALIETETLTGAVPGLVGDYVGALSPLL